MNEITQGTIVKTASGVVGRVIKVIAINTVRYYRLARLIECRSGRLQETGQWAFIQDKEITHVRGVWTPVQPVIVAPVAAAPTTEQVITAARAAFEVAIAPCEAAAQIA